MADTPSPQLAPQPAHAALALGPVAGAGTPSVCFASPRLPCSKRFANIFYCTEQRAFWLLPTRAAALIDEAIHLLERQIAAGKPAAERMEGLNQCGLLDYFLEPHLSNFLEGAAKARLLELEAEHPYIDDPALAMRMRARDQPVAKGLFAKDAAKRRWQAAEAERKRFEADHQAHRERLALKKEWAALRERAIGQARQQGYVHQRGSLFSPQAVEANARVQAYLKAREEVLADPDFAIYQADEIARLLAEDKLRFEQAMDCRVNCQAAFKSFWQWRETQSAKLAFAQYREAIVQVAEYGLALPEYALLPSPTLDLAAGIALFKRYLHLQRRQHVLTAEIRGKYEQWVKATGELAAAPRGLARQEREQWEALRAEAEALRRQAEANVAATAPRRHLLWNPEAFEPAPVERLMRTDFPLREVSLPGSGAGPLSYFSVLNLAQMGEQLKHGLSQGAVESAKLLRHAPASSDGGADIDTAASALHHWLAEQQAVRIGDQEGDWFDAQGWFDVERCYAYLRRQGYGVESLEDGARRAAWGEQLRQVLFEDSVRERMRLFDASPEARLVRCLAPPQANIHESLVLTAPSMSMTRGLNAMGRVSLDVDLARGEVQLLNADLPAREKAEPLVLRYTSTDGEVRALNVGRFSLNLNARAWGFAGASLMLAGQLEVGLWNTRYGTALTPDQPATRSPGTVGGATTLASSPLPGGRARQATVDKGVTGQFNLFAGTQAGIQLTGALNWAPPRELAMINRGNSIQPGPANGWMSLGRLTLGASVGFGLGAGASFELSLHDGRLILALKASLISGPGATGNFRFEVGYEALVDILNLFRRELHRNNNRPLDWVQGSAADYLSRMNALGALGLDPAMVYLIAYDKVMSLFEALIRPGRGGIIALMIVRYGEEKGIRKWVTEAPASALGPLLYTLVSAPRAFAAGNEATYSRAQSWHFQQQAITRILSWVAEGEEFSTSQYQFVESCIRMNKFGVRREDAEGSYCRNRQVLDRFMKVPVLGLSDPGADLMRARYTALTQRLGAPAETCPRAGFFTRGFE